MIAYNMYFNKDGTEMTVFQIHPDSASAEYQMKITDSAFAKFVEYIEMKRIDIYGEPSHDLMVQMRRKAEMLGGEAFVVHEL